MSSPESAKSGPSGSTLTPADRIRQLNQINEKIPQILTAAATALQNLKPTAPTPLPAHIKPPPDVDEEDDSDEEEEEDRPLARLPDPSEPAYNHKSAFLKCMQSYSDLVFSLQASLFEQIDALQEAGIITTKGTESEGAFPDTKDPKKPEGKEGKEGKDAGVSVTAGQLGGMDVGWLNERGKDTGRAFESELMAEAREMLEGLLGHEKASDISMSGT